MTDYNLIFDTATAAFVQTATLAYPKGTNDLPMSEQRRIYDQFCRQFYRVSDVQGKDHHIAGVQCRIYDGAEPNVIYLHGGGFVMGSLDSYDEICANIASATGQRVICVAYRLSPEHAHPAALTDALSVTRAVMGPVILVGDSAGGTLAAAVAQQVTVLGQVLVYPMLGGDPTKGSYMTHALAPMLTTADVAYYNTVRGPVVDATTHPLLATDFSNLPPTIAFGAECDPLCDDARNYAAAITAAGGTAMFVCEQGLPHGYLRARHSVPRAADSFARICSAISSLGGQA